MADLAERLSTRHLDGPETEPVELDRSRIYILPTRHGMVFALVLLVMLLGSINYNNSLGFALTFLLASMSMVSILHTYRNLVGLRIHSVRAEPVFSGQHARFPLVVEAARLPHRYAVAVLGADGHVEVADIPFLEGARATLVLRVPTQRRGIQRPGRAKIFTEYPLGLFRAWSWVEPQATGLVYPRPEAAPPPALDGNPEAGDALDDRRPGTEDFRGLRDYQPGDSMRHIAWKQLAACEEVLTKEFGGSASTTVWLDWHTLDGLDVEARLSRLCRWVLDSHQAGHRYGLRMPDQIIQPDTGKDHRQRCLAALALFRIAASQRTAPAGGHL